MGDKAKRVYGTRADKRKRIEAVEAKIDEQLACRHTNLNTTCTDCGRAVYLVAVEYRAKDDTLQS